MLPSFFQARCQRVSALSARLSLLGLFFLGLSSSARPTLAQSTAPTFAVLRAFKTEEGSNVAVESRLIQASNGLLYGARMYGGVAERGTIVRIAPDGTGFTVLRTFSPADGVLPIAVLQAKDGLIYGTTGYNGPAGYGTIYRMSLDGGNFTVVHAFSGYAQGLMPAALIEGADGRLYGTCSVFGARAAAFSAIFRVDRNGSNFSILRAFNPLTDGEPGRTSPGIAIVQGPDGRLYGSANGGGKNKAGTLFRLNTDGSGFTVLRHMAPADGTSPNGLLVSKSGKLFGTAYAGGASDQGTVFRLELDGSNFVVLRSFVGNYPSPIQTQHPIAGLTEGDDGGLYGISQRGGDLREYGTVFRIDPTSGAYRLLHSFVWEHGGFPEGELLKGTHGRFYGMTRTGGASAHGTLFSWTAGSAELRSKATVGSPFTYPLAALFGEATTYSADALPSGLSVNPLTGEIAGTPRNAGKFSVSVKTSSPWATAPVTLDLEVAKGAARIEIANLNQVFDGFPKPVTVTTHPAVNYRVVYSRALTPPTLPGTYNVAVLVEDANYEGFASATLTISGSTPVIVDQSGNTPVVAGDTLTLRTTVAGAAPLTFQWQRKTTGSPAFTDVENGNGFSGTNSPTLVIQPASLALHGDQFRLKISNPLGTFFGDPLTLTVYPSSILTNIAVRAVVGPDDPLTVGFVTNGTRRVLVRGIGPGLAPFLGNTPSIAADPSLIVSDAANVTLATNQNWGGTSALAAAFVNLGAFALAADSLDAALLSDVKGAVTARMNSANTGIGLIEVYDAGAGPASRVVNFSALHRVTSDGLVAGFAITGTGTKRLLVRGVGPTLRSFHVDTTLSDCRLDVFTASGAFLVGNDDWPANLAAVFNQAGAFPLPDGSKDAALVLSVPPGTYTLHLSGIGGSDGKGLLEIYELP